MPNKTSSVSIADLSAAGVQLRASEAVAVARDIALRAASGELAGIPSVEAIRLNVDGSVGVEGPVAAGTEVTRAARLLAALVSNATPDVSAPAMFRLILARALASDEAAYDSLEPFAEALAPFAAPDVATAVRELLSTSYTAQTSLAAEEPMSRALEPEPAGRARSAWVPALAIAALLAVGVLARWMSPWPGRAAPSLPAVAAPPEVAAAPQQTGALESVASAPAVLAPATVDTPTPPPVSGRSEASASAASPAKSAAATTEVLSNAAFSPSFASATAAMFYHSGTGPGSAIMRADTDDRGEVLRVTSVMNDRGANFHPRPSPDGQAIAFDSDRDGERGVYIAAADGKGVRRVSGSGFAAVPSWSPDGRRLAYVRAEAEHPRVWNIWTVDVASGQAARVTSHRVGQPWGAAWFPDGERIAYSNETRLIVQSLDGGAVRAFNTPVRGRLVRTPAVSPDGKQIIFQVRRDGAWMLDLTTDTMRRVLEDPSAEEFTWSPDGRRVAYHSRRSGKWGVWMMSPRD